MLQSAAGGGAVNVEVIAGPAEGSWDYVGLSFQAEAQVTEKGFVEDPVGRFAIIEAELRLARDASARSWSVGLCHQSTPEVSKDGSRSVTVASVHLAV
jgi:hypothetical protein